MPMLRGFGKKKAYVLADDVTPLQSGFSRRAVWLLEIIFDEYDLAILVDQYGSRSRIGERAAVFDRGRKCSNKITTNCRKMIQSSTLESSGRLRSNC